MERLPVCSGSLLCCTAACGSLWKPRRRQCMRPYDRPDGIVEVRLQLLKAYRFIFQYGAVAGRAGKLCDQKEHGLRGAQTESGIRLDQLLEIIHAAQLGVIFTFRHGLPEDAPAQIFGNEPEDRLVFFQLSDHIIYDKDYLVLKGRDIRFLELLVGGQEQLPGGLSNEPVPDIILILKIKIERALCHTGLLDDIMDGCLDDPL